jgi:hypothetical protein
VNLFGKAQEIQAFAVTVENGRDVASKEMKNAKNYRDPRSRYGSEITYEIAVRVEPSNQTPFDAKMKTPHSKAYLLSLGVRVQVKYDPKSTKSVIFDDSAHDIQARNPQLKPSEWQGWLDELLKKEMSR